MKSHFLYPCKINTSIDCSFVAKKSHENRLKGNLVEVSFYLTARKGK